MRFRQEFQSENQRDAGETDTSPVLRRCATERVILTRRGRPICWLQPFPKTRQESDAELLRSVFEFVPYGRGGLVLDLDILAQPTAGNEAGRLPSIRVVSIPHPALTDAS